MITLPTFEDFVDAASYDLRAEGARSLLPDDRLNVPEWASPWREILLIDAPGAGALVSFTHADGLHRKELQARVDGLVAGLAGLGLFQAGPLRLEIVSVFSGTASSTVLDAAASVVPKAFFPGLRPHAYAVDLERTRLYGRRGGSVRPVLESALTLRDSGLRNVHELEARRAVSRSRTQQFYSLMQGRRPLVTYTLLALNLLIFAAMVVTGSATERSVVLHGGGFADGTVRSWGALSPGLIEHGQWWRLASEMFLHGSLTHIIFNMASLLAVGSLAERLYGGAKYLAIYLGAGIIGSVCSFGFAIAHGNDQMLAVGASGAIFGVAGALVTVRFQQSAVIPASVRRGISSSMLPLVAISLALAAMTAYVDNSAHVGGLIGGMMLSFIFRLGEPRLPGADLSAQRPSSLFLARISALGSRAKDGP